MKNTLVVNLYGAPGSGKSTGAAYLFSRLKMNGVDCEYVPEFAKSAVWEERGNLFKDPEEQFFIFANQFHAMNVLYGKVDVIVTDSPLLLTLVYNRSVRLDGPYEKVVLNLNSKFSRHLDYMVLRDMAYDRNGRNETKEESDKIQEEIRKMLHRNDVTYFDVKGNKEGYTSLFSMVMTVIGRKVVS